MLDRLERRLIRIRDLFIPSVFGLLVLITLVCVLSSCATSTSGGAATGAVTATGSHQPIHPTASPAGRIPAGSASDGTMATVAVGDLPPEARTTIGLIASDGPFPYRQDGVVFQNRERQLPREPSGYYHEYTVKTPGSRDRGARRIIKARDGTLYYTSDHYRSFRRIIQ